MLTEDDFRGGLASLADRASIRDDTVVRVRAAAGRRRRRQGLSAVSLLVVVAAGFTLIPSRTARTSLHSVISAASDTPPPLTSGSHPFTSERHAVPAHLPAGVHLLTAGYTDFPAGSPIPSSGPLPDPAHPGRAVAGWIARFGIDGAANEAQTRAPATTVTLFEAPAVGTGPTLDFNSQYETRTVVEIGGVSGFLTITKNGYGVRAVEWSRNGISYVLAFDRLNTPAGPSGIAIDSLIEMARAVS
jgi:hypothetical protein